VFCCVCLFLSFFLLRSSASWTGLTTSAPLHFRIQFWNRAPVAHSVCLISLLGSARCKLCFCIGLNERAIQTHSHASSGIQAGGPNVWANEVDRCVACRPHGQRSRQMFIVLVYVKQTLHKVKTNGVVHLMSSIKKTQLRSSLPI
jgi:hypothetical protein